MSWDDGGVDGMAKDIPERADIYTRTARMVLAVVKQAFEVDAGEAECEFDFPTGERIKVKIEVDYKRDRVTPQG